MIYKFKHKLLNIRDAVGFWHNRRRQTRYDPLPVIRGNMRRVIVIQPPDPIFSEAMFILRDDYFQSPGVSSQDLLKQAKAAAEGCLDESIPSAPVRPIFPTAVSIFALGAAAAIFALWLGGVI